MPVQNEFNVLMKSLIDEAKSAPVAHFMIAQMQQEEPEHIVIRSEKVKRLARCVKNKGANNAELKRQAKIISKLLNHLKSKRDFVSVEPLLDFTLGQYNCV